MSHNCLQDMHNRRHKLGKVLLYVSVPVFLGPINTVHPYPCTVSLQLGTSAASQHACLQIRQVQHRTCTERVLEVQHLLDSWQWQRAQQEVSAADRREAVAVATQQKR